MNPLVKQIIDEIIVKKCFLADYPKPGVVFLSVAPLFKDQVSRELLAKVVRFAVKAETFDIVAGIASRGYLFSGIIAGTHAGELLIQKVKAKDK